MNHEYRNFILCIDLNRKRTKRFAPKVLLVEFSELVPYLHTKFQIKLLWKYRDHKKQTVEKII